MIPSALQQAVAAIPHWYHAIELPCGIVTPGWAPYNSLWYKFPADLTGKRVLDVGAWDGYWTFQALQAGAAEVVAIDDFSDTLHAGERRSWDGFDLCARTLGLSDRITRLEGSVYDVHRMGLGVFDVVLCYGVLYHCRHPLLALDVLSAVCRDTLLVESAICDDLSPYRVTGRYADMVMEFYPGAELGGYAGNWWGPTCHCLAAMVRSAGFKWVESWHVARPDSFNQARGFVRGMKEAS
jgi:tRNA (mo5U34)-methyltransferase